MLAALAGLPMPLMPLQILWLNMVTDTFPALALALEPGDEDVMARPPRNPAEALLSRRFLVSVMFYGALITGATLGAFLLYADGPRAPGADGRVHDAGPRSAVSSWERPERIAGARR